MFYLKNSGIEIYNPEASGKTLYFLAAERVEPPVPEGCCVVMVYPYDWTEMMTPWAYSGRGMENTGGGAEFAESFEADLIYHVEARLGHEVERRGIAGYSLGGLEAFYMASRMKNFDYAGSVSGSFWYAGAAEYFSENALDDRIKKVYMSLGASEEKTKNAERRTVRTNTDAIASHIGRTRELCYEINNGGHFTETEKRIGKCIEYFAVD
ncbi:MAG: hypothetical protein HDT13_01765 [Butyrivibrio sp.]|nr:hypothetical protein [Butyrivibrio sp.]